MGVKGNTDFLHARIHSYKSEQPAVMAQTHGEVNKSELTCRKTSSTLPFPTVM